MRTTNSITQALTIRDGTYGDTLLVNGTINPYVEVKNEQIRLRLVNGSNARNYTFGLENAAVFHQIASDGGFLEQPVALTSVTLTPGERAEISRRPERIR